MAVQYDYKQWRNKKGHFLRKAKQEHNLNNAFIYVIVIKK